MIEEMTIMAREKDGSLMAVTTPTDDIPLSSSKFRLKSDPDFEDFDILGMYTYHLHELIIFVQF